jgi:hypothetical protein
MRGRKPRQSSNEEASSSGRYHRPMRKLVTWLLVTLGVAALVRKLRRREAQPEPAPVEPPADDPAGELRRKLEETRTEEDAPASPAAEASIEERRAEVHGQGRAAVEEMQPSDDEE